jgi:hypothetical protein
VPTLLQAWSQRAVIAVLVSWLWPGLILAVTLVVVPIKCLPDWYCGPDWTYAQFFLWLAITIVPPSVITWLALFSRGARGRGAA